MDKSTLESLLERVEKATGPDRELDADLFVALVEPTWTTSKKDHGFVAADKRAFWPEGKARFITLYCKPAPQYTASIDAALALVDRALPINSVKMDSDPSGCGAKITWWPDGLSGGKRLQGDGHNVSVPLAILAALLKALIARAEQ